MFGPIYRFLQSIGYPHPIHPTEVHMPIGLVVGAFILTLVAVMFKKEKPAAAARYGVILAFIWAFPTILFGYMDWQYFFSGTWFLPIKVKLALAPLLILFLGISILLSRKYGPASKIVLFLYALSFCTVVVLGYFGGQLVYSAWTPPASKQYREGEQLFKANCSGCHPSGGNVVQPRLPVINSEQLGDFDKFNAFIRDPREPDGSTGIMPAFPESKISTAQARQLYEYILNVLQGHK